MSTTDGFIGMFKVDNTVVDLQNKTQKLSASGNVAAPIQIATGGRFETAVSSEVTAAVTIPTTGTVTVFLNDTSNFPPSGTANAETATGLQAFTYTGKDDEISKLTGCVTTALLGGAVPLAVGDTITIGSALGLLYSLGLKVLNGIIKGTKIIGSSLISSIIETGESSNKIGLYSSDNSLRFYTFYYNGSPITIKTWDLEYPGYYERGIKMVNPASGTILIKITTGGDGAVTYFETIEINSSVQINGDLHVANELAVGATKFLVNSSGQITLVNNIGPTAKKVLIGDGTSFTPRLLALADLPAVTANKVLISDASGYVTTSSVSNVALSYLDTTSSIQTQLNGKVKSYDVYNGYSEAATADNATAATIGIWSQSTGKGLKLRTFYRHKVGNLNLRILGNLGGGTEGVMATMYLKVGALTEVSVAYSVPAGLAYSLKNVVAGVSDLTDGNVYEILVSLEDTSVVGNAYLKKDIVISVENF